MQRDAEGQVKKRIRLQLHLSGQRAWVGVGRRGRGYKVSYLIGSLQFSLLSLSFSVVVTVVVLLLLPDQIELFVIRQARMKAMRAESSDEGVQGREE